MNPHPHKVGRSGFKAFRAIDLDVVVDVSSVRMRRRSLALLAGLAALSGCTHVAPYERGKLAHPTMSPEGLGGPAAEHVQAVHEGATGGGDIGGGGCGCN
jgi:hypothetical protein